MKIIDDIINIIRGKKEEVDPWNAEPEEKKVITQDEIAEAVKEMGIPKPSNPYKLIFLQGFTILWILAHFVLLYVGIGTPLSMGILVYVLINFFIFSHYLILLRGTNNDVQAKD